MARIRFRSGPTPACLVADSSGLSLCTPASGTRAEIRYIKATNNDTSTRTFCISIGANSAANRLIDQVQIPANSEYERHVLWPIAAAEVVCVNADTASKVYVTISGDKIDAT